MNKLSWNHLWLWLSVGVWFIDRHKDTVMFVVSFLFDVPPRHTDTIFNIVNVFPYVSFSCLWSLQRSWKRRRRTRQRQSSQKNRNTSFATESSSSPGSMRVYLRHTSGTVHPQLIICRQCPWKVTHPAMSKSSAAYFLCFTWCSLSPNQGEVQCRIIEWDWSRSFIPWQRGESEKRKENLICHPLLFFVLSADCVKAGLVMLNILLCVKC